MYKEMSRALASFENGSAFQHASSKEKAFYSALRTLLGDISCIADDQARITKLTAAFKWFSKNRCACVS